jgi:hypothetical protein
MLSNSMKDLVERSVVIIGIKVTNKTAMKGSYAKETLETNSELYPFKGN